jgi:hypothetical protein
VHDHGLGQLELKPSRRQSGIQQDRAHLIDQG